MRDVACPVVRQAGRILAFRHPLAGGQLVKGGIEPGETPEAAAIRELSEEAGVMGTTPILMQSVELAERWYIVSVQTAVLPETWVHRCADDGGHDFAFFWTDCPTDLVAPHATILEHLL